VEFFKERVEAACTRQHVDVSPSASFYVVNLLAEFARSGAGSDPLASDEALGVRFARALQGGGAMQRLGLQQVGDASLFISGFFSDSLRRSLVDVDYYMTLGGHAYESLSATGDARSPIFAELADRFVALVDVLSDVSERTSIGRDSDLLRLYEKWIRTGSRRSGELLAERGIVPNASIVGTARRVQ
jgi:hypothetical protein